jgi:hypothetical protein
MDQPSPYTPGAYRKKSDRELENALNGGPISNLDVQCALAEIQRRSSERQERWSKRAYAAAIIAAGAALAGTVAAWLALFK